MKIPYVIGNDITTAVQCSFATKEIRSDIESLIEINNNKDFILPMRYDVVVTAWGYGMIIHSKHREEKIDKLLE